MELKRYHASRESRHGEQIAECLEIGRLAICRETTDHRLHLLYQQNIPSLLQEAGYEVRTEELHIPILGENFSELQYAVYKGRDCEVYFFDGLAVKASVDSIKCHVQEGLTPENLARIWDDTGIDWTEPDSECQVPPDLSGKIAVQIEQLQYDAWDTLYRAPGEDMAAEERIDAIQRLYDGIKKPEATYPVLDDIKQSLTEELDDLNADWDSMGPERLEYASGRIDDINCLLEKVESARQEYSVFADAAMTDQSVSGIELTMQ